MAIVDMLPQPGGSSEETLTVLWENNNPTASFSPTSESNPHTLSESLLGYKTMRIEFRPFSESESSAHGFVDIPVEYLARLTKATNSPMFALAGYGTSYFYHRIVYVPSSATSTLDKLHFLACYRTNNTEINNNYCVPLKVYGIK